MLTLGVYLIANRTIFIAPLDWGLGHATRLVPVIRSLQDNNTIVIGITPINSSFFDELFPGLQKIALPSYHIHYSHFFPAWLSVLFQSSKIRAVIRKERNLIKDIILRFKIDLVISDSRFGLHTPGVECIFVCHQLNVRSPVLSFFANLVNSRLINRFNEVWVPDYEDQSKRLSGELSDGKNIKIPIRFIGPKSAIAKTTPIPKGNERIDILILLSGVEPQRTVIEKTLLEIFSNTRLNVVMVRGSSARIQSNPGSMRIVDVLYGNDLADIIVNAGTVICRSGYSTLMDMHLLEKKNLILVPTPGQTEQEYLADYWHKKFETKVVRQNELKKQLLRIISED